jgi:hypothetical protein
MSSERASVFDHGPDIDISGFKPRTAAKPAAQPDQVKAVSETANFVSRDPIRAPLQPDARPARLHEPRLREAQRNGQSSEGRDTQNLSREAQREPITREPRRHRTGRNIQLNIKARAETIDRFYAIADRHGWVLGETFERAISELERTCTN